MYVYDIDSNYCYTGVAGEAFAEGEVVCVLASDGLLYKAKADDATLRLCVGVATQAAVTADIGIKKITACRNCKVGGMTLTRGERQWMSATAGTVTNTLMVTDACQYLLVGIALTTKIMQVDFLLSKLGLGSQDTGASTLKQV